MSHQTHASEAFIRVQLHTGLSITEIEQLHAEAKTRGSLDALLIDIIRDHLRESQARSLKSKPKSPHAGK